MIRFLPILLVGLVLAVPAAAAAAERRYSVTDFERVVVEGPYIVHLTTGRPSAASASGTQPALERVLIDVQSGTLRIRRNRSYWGGNPGEQQGPLTIELSTRILRSARLVGPATLDVEGVEGLRVDLIVEGSGRLRASDVHADNLSLGLLGSGRIEASGAAETVRAEVQGTGDLDASGLEAESATIMASTLGNVSLAVAREVTVNAMGLGNVEIVGDPACNVRGPGAGQVICSNQR